MTRSAISLGPGHIRMSSVSMLLSHNTAPLQSPTTRNAVVAAQACAEHSRVDSAQATTSKQKTVSCGNTTVKLPFLRQEFLKEIGMYEACKHFQAVDNAGSRPMKVHLPVHSIDVTLADGWQIIPARQLRQHG